jgi:lipopolysaccharide transport system ATP-binding protein
MPAVTNLCTTAIWLKEGKVLEQGMPKDVVHSYVSSSKEDQPKYNWDDEETAPGNEIVKLKSVKVFPKNEENYITVQTPIQLDVEFWCLQEDFDINVNVRLLTGNGECVFDLGSPTIKAEKGVLALIDVIPGNLLNNSSYSISLTVVKNNSSPIFEFSECISFEVEDIRDGIYYFGTWPGIIRPPVDSLLYVKEAF